MAQQLINIGRSPNDGSGDTLRSGATKINANFAELYSKTDFVLTPATVDTLGGVKIDGTTITISDGVISAAGVGNYNLQTASTSVLGGVKIDGTTITISNGVISSVPPVNIAGNAGTVTNGVYLTGGQTIAGVKTFTSTIIGSINGNAGSVTNGVYTTGSYANPSWITSFAYNKLTGTPTLSTVATSGSYTDLINTPAAYSLPVASTSTLGGVKVDGTTITLNGSNQLVATQYTLPPASNSTLGGVKIDGTTITLNGSNQIVATQYTLPVANTSTLGGVKIDGTTITLNGLNQLVAAQYTLPTASNSTLGGVKVDNTTITISSGTISATTIGLQGRTTVSTTTSSLSNGASAIATVIGAKGYALYSIQVSAGAWVSVYTSPSAQAADSGRSITTDPTPGSGVVAESVTVASGTTYFTPAVVGFNAEGTPSTNIYLRITNNSGSTNSITVTLTYLALEI